MGVFKQETACMSHQSAMYTDLQLANVIILSNQKCQANIKETKVLWNKIIHCN